MKDSCDEKDPSVCSAVGGACGQACNSPDKDCCAYWNMTGNIDSHKAGCCDVWYNNKDSSHQSFCCEDDAWAQSHSDWCDTCKPGSDNYYSNQCCNKRYSAYAFEVVDPPPNYPLAKEYAEYINHMYDEDACKCACSQNSQSYFCKHYCGEDDGSHSTTPSAPAKRKVTWSVQGCEIIGSYEPYTGSPWAKISINYIRGANANFNSDHISIPNGTINVCNGGSIIFTQNCTVYSALGSVISNECIGSYVEHGDDYLK